MGQINWQYDNKDFTENDIGDNYGFVYVITHLNTGRMYIGKKFFYSMKTKVLKGKKYHQTGKLITDLVPSCKMML